MSIDDQGVAPASQTPGQQASPSAASAAPQSAVPNAGDVFRVRYPFIVGTYDTHELDPSTGYWDKVTPVKSWQPGVSFEMEGYGCQEYTSADAEGEMVLSVVATCPIPRPYQTRVFYTRRFIDPSGKLFGKGGLRVDTLEKFRRLTRGYRHEYDVDPSVEAETLLASAAGARKGRDAQRLDGEAAPERPEAIAEGDAQTLDGGPHED